ncbi:MAG TPA: SDR family oxidoreductase [Anaerolineaceae bacterium]
MILVTGAAGHIGNVLVRELLERDEQVRVLVLPGEDVSSLEGLELERMEGNVLDPFSLTNAMKDVQQVFHLAGMISIMPGKEETVRAVNVRGTINVLEAAREARVERVVYTSSIHALKRMEEGYVVNEAVPFDPQNAVGAYDRSKAEASLAALEAARDGLDVVIVCPTGVVGPFDFRLSEMGKLIFDWTHSRLHFMVDGAFDFVDVRDVAHGHVLAAEKGRRGEAYILSGEKISLERLSQFVQKAVGGKSLQIRVPAPLAFFATNFTPFYYRLTRQIPRFTRYSLETVTGNSLFSNSKARKELGFNPRPLSESITDTVAWLRKYAQMLARKKHYA